jgi:glycerol uptake facilitator-like aquaporin
MKFNLRSRAAAEFLGTAFLLAAVGGPGIMGERLAGGNVAIALLANTLATAKRISSLGKNLHVFLSPIHLQCNCPVIRSTYL